MELDKKDLELVYRALMKAKFDCDNIDEMTTSPIVNRLLEKIGKNIGNTEDHYLEFFPDYLNSVKTIMNYYREKRPNDDLKLFLEITIFPFKVSQNMREKLLVGT